MNLENIKILFRQYNLKPNFTYGQNFLVDPEALNKIVTSAEILPTDNILEIGPGIGNLTRRLCEQAGWVLAVEKDPKFFPVLKSLKKEFPLNFSFEIADVLEFNFQKVLANSGRGSVNSKKKSHTKHHPPFTGHLSYKVVANIPYYITGKILTLLLNAKNKPSSIVVLTQKEVAERICAKQGDLSVLAISVQLFGNPKIIDIIPKASFYPAPKVDSAILRIDILPGLKYKIKDEHSFFRVVKSCFAGKRKQIHNTLTNNLAFDKQKTFTILQDLRISPSARPQELSIEQWINLSDKITRIVES